LFALFAADDFDASLQDGWNQRRGEASASTWPHPIMVEGDRRSWGIRWPGASWLGILIFVRRTTLPAQFTLEKSNGIPDKCPAT